MRSLKAVNRLFENFETPESITQKLLREHYKGEDRVAGVEANFSTVTDVSDMFRSKVDRLYFSQTLENVVTQQEFLIMRNAVLPDTMLEKYFFVPLSEPGGVSLAEMALDWHQDSTSFALIALPEGAMRENSLYFKFGENQQDILKTIAFVRESIAKSPIKHEVKFDQPIPTVVALSNQGNVVHATPGGRLSVRTTFVNEQEYSGGL